MNDLSTHSAIDDEIKAFWRDGCNGTFSGLIVLHGERREILHNDYHHPFRQNSNIAHELAHIILGHPLTKAIKLDGQREFDTTVEEEAKWLGAALLLPKEATKHIALNAIPNTQVQKDYGVSDSLLQYRLRVTDAFGYARNARSKYGAQIPVST